MRAALLLAFLALTACGGSGAAPSTTPFASLRATLRMTESSAPTRVTLSVASRSDAESKGEPLVTKGDTSLSWMSPQAKSAKQLLYVSDLGNFVVWVFSYPALEPLGKLTGFVQPQGLCTDSAGNVWIANTEGSQMREYAHGGTKPIAKLTDAFGYPAGCAVDPRTGNLAVTNIENFSGRATVLVYKHARGTPAVFGNNNLAAFYFAGYDPNGNLYVSARTGEKTFALGVLARGARSIALVTIKGGTIYFPGTVAWQGSKLVAGDQRCNKRASSCLYRLSIAGSTATIAGSTPLGGACDVAQAWVAPKRVAGGDYAKCAHRSSSADLWRYPGGGEPLARATGLQQPVGAVVSAAAGP